MKIQPILATFSVFFVVLFQISFATLLPIFGSTPNLLLIFLLALVFGGWERQALWGAFFGGALWDLLSMRTLGVTSFVLVILLSLVIFSRRFYLSPLVPFLGVVFLASFILRGLWNPQGPGVFFRIWFGGTILDVLTFIAARPLVTLVARKLFESPTLQLTFKNRL